LAGTGPLALAPPGASSGEDATPEADGGRLAQWIDTLLSR
jgi:hypothetical protein